MTNTLYAKKIGMTEAYVGETRRGVTVVELLPMTVLSQKTTTKHGYAATQVAIGQKSQKAPRPLAGQLKALSHTPALIREIESLPDLEIGTLLEGSELIKPGALLSVTGTSKGKGLAGVVKRWHFAGGPRTHGQSDRLRRPGSIGQGTTPGRVYKGKKMSGRMGNETVTVSHLTTLSYDPQTHKLYIAGAVPGHIGSVVKLSLSRVAPDTFPPVTHAPKNTSPVVADVVESEAV